MREEATARKATWNERESEPVRFADGQEWRVIKPWLEIRPKFVGHVARSCYPVYTYGGAIDDLIAALSAAEDLDAQLGGVASLAAWLLRESYVLDDGDLDGLLHFRGDDETTLGWTAAVVEIAAGRKGARR